MIKSFLKIPRVLITTLVMLIVLGGTVFISVCFLFGNTMKWKYNVSNFEAYQKDYESIGMYCLQYGDGQCCSKLFTYNSIKDQLIYRGEIVELSKAERQSLDQIRRSFPHKDAQFDSIQCKNGMVYFETHNGLYSVVYSPTGKPELVDGKNSGTSKKIIENWYHVVKE